MKKVCLRKSQESGFTIVEVLVVIIVLGAMAGALMNIINPSRQRDYARDGVLRQNLDDISKILETYRVAEGAYPTDADGDHNPLNDAGSGSLDQYMDEWPSSDFIYIDDGSDFAVYVESKVNPGNYFKYNSVRKKIQECGATNIGLINGCE